MSSSSQLLDEAVGATEVATGAVGAALRPIGSSNIWARSGGSGGGATGGAVGVIVGATESQNALLLARGAGADSG